jgi:hypothetical protein
MDLAASDGTELYLFSGDSGILLSFTTKTVLAVQCPAKPGPYRLPVRHHEEVVGPDKGRGDMQCQAGGGRAEEMLRLRTDTTNLVIAMVV